MAAIEDVAKSPAEAEEATISIFKEAPTKSKAKEKVNAKSTTKAKVKQAPSGSAVGEDSNALDVAPEAMLEDYALNIAKKLEKPSIPRSTALWLASLGAETKAGAQISVDPSSSESIKVFDAEPSKKTSNTSKSRKTAIKPVAGEKTSNAGSVAPPTDIINEIKTRRSNKKDKDHNNEKLVAETGECHISYLVNQKFIAYLKAELKDALARPEEPITTGKCLLV